MRYTEGCFGRLQLPLSGIVLVIMPLSQLVNRQGKPPIECTKFSQEEMVRKLAGNCLPRDSLMVYAGFSGTQKDTKCPVSALWKLMLKGATREQAYTPRQMLHQKSRYRNGVLGECWGELAQTGWEQRTGWKRAQDDFSRQLQEDRTL